MTQRLIRQVRDGFRDRRDAAECAAAEHRFGKFDFEAVFQSQHDSDGGQRGEARAIQVEVFVQGEDIDGQTSVLSEHLSDGIDVDGRLHGSVGHDVTTPKNSVGLSGRIRMSRMVSMAEI